MGATLDKWFPDLEMASYESMPLLGVFGGNA